MEPFVILIDFITRWVTDPIKELFTDEDEMVDVLIIKNKTNEATFESKSYTATGKNKIYEYTSPIKQRRLKTRSRLMSPSNSFKTSPRILDFEFDLDVE